MQIKLSFDGDDGLVLQVFLNIPILPLIQVLDISGSLSKGIEGTIGYKGMLSGTIGVKRENGKIYLYYEATIVGHTYSGKIPISFWSNSKLWVSISFRSLHFYFSCPFLSSVLSVSLQLYIATHYSQTLAMIKLLRWNFLNLWTARPTRTKPKMRYLAEIQNPHRSWPSNCHFCDIMMMSNVWTSSKRCTMPLNHEIRIEQPGCQKQPDGVKL